MIPYTRPSSVPARTPHRCWVSVCQGATSPRGHLHFRDDRRSALRLTYTIANFEAVSDLFSATPFRGPFGDIVFVRVRLHRGLHFLQSSRSAGHQCSTCSESGKKRGCSDYCRRRGRYHLSWGSLLRAAGLADSDWAKRRPRYHDDFNGRSHVARGRQFLRILYCWNLRRNTRHEPAHPVLTHGLSLFISSRGRKCAQLWQDFIMRGCRQVYPLTAKLSELLVGIRG